MISKAVIKLLSSTSSITSKVSTRIYPNVLKTDSAFPALVVSAQNMRVLGCDAALGIQNGTIEIYLFAANYNDVTALRNSVSDTLTNYSGTLNNVGLTTMNIVNDEDDYDSERNIHIKVITYEAMAQLKS